MFTTLVPSKTAPFTCAHTHPILAVIVEEKTIMELLWAYVSCFTEPSPSHWQDGLEVFSGAEIFPVVEASGLRHVLSSDR